jgi:hypothetical protein
MSGYIAESSKENVPDYHYLETHMSPTLFVFTIEVMSSDFDEVAL